MNTAQPTPRIVTWTGYIAFALLLALPLGILAVRAGQWQPGLAVYALACAGATVLLLLFLILGCLPKLKAQRGAIAKRAATTLPGAFLALSVLAGQGDAPPIHDITTDTLNPPVFATALTARGEDSNPLDIKPDSIEAQKQAYPDLATLRNSDTLANNFQRATATATDLGWEIYHSDLNSGIIEAVDTTKVMGFKDDIIIRLQQEGGETLIDLRSVSRVGLGDLGANAKRIRAFQDLFIE